MIFQFEKSPCSKFGEDALTANAFVLHRVVKRWKPPDSKLPFEAYLVKQAEPRSFTHQASWRFMLVFLRNACPPICSLKSFYDSPTKIRNIRICSFPDSLVISLSLRSVRVFSLRSVSLDALIQIGGSFCAGNLGVWM